MQSVEFTIRLAERTFAVSVRNPFTKDYCADYLTDAEPQFRVEITEKDIEFERLKTARANAAAGISARQPSDGYLESQAVHRKIADLLLRDNTVLFHGSAVAVDGVGYLFTAKSGTGKSTHTRLWRECFGSRAAMVNDDKPLIHIGADGARVYGTPWNGKHHLGSNISVPLRAICLLERGNENHIECVEKGEAFPTLFRQCYRPKDPEGLGLVMKLLDTLGSQTRLYRLQCNMDPEAAVISYRGMNERG